MGKYQAYLEYKDSDVDLLGSVPKHWVVGRYKFCTNRIVVGIAEAATHAYADEGVPIIRSTNIRERGLDTNGLLFIKPEFAEQNYSKYLYENDIITVRTGYPGISSVIPKSLNKSQCFTNLVASPKSSFIPEFLAHFLNSHAGKTYFDLLGWGSAQKNISVPILQNIPVAYPSKHEQENIVKFLDHETAKIDTLIEKQQQLIALLKEKCQAVISHAVTKGLNANAPMRDSGVEWLGGVPEHWGVSALKYHVDTVNGFGFSSSDVCEEGVPFIRAGNIKKKSVTRANLYLPKGIVDRHKRVILSEGDIVISMVGSDPRILESAVGQIGIVPKSMAGAVPNQNVVILREKTDLLLKKFLFYALCSDSYRNHLNIFSHKLANQSIISSSLIVNAKFMLPSAEEQSEVIKFLDQQLTKFDEVMERNNYSLTLLKERRTALISAAVTGKIDVRSWIAPEPSDCKNKETVG